MANCTGAVLGVWKFQNTNFPPDQSKTHKYTCICIGCKRLYVVKRMQMCGQQNANCAKIDLKCHIPSNKTAEGYKASFFDEGQPIMWYTSISSDSIVELCQKRASTQILCNQNEPSSGRTEQTTHGEQQAASPVKHSIATPRALGNDHSMENNKEGSSQVQRFVEIRAQGMDDDLQYSDHETTMT